MKISYFVKKFISAFVLSIVFIAIVINFSVFFPTLNHNALALINSETKNPINIPSNINFLNDDKKAFCDYMKNLYGQDLPLSVDNDLFVYYGAVNGYRFYRLQSMLIPLECTHQTEIIGSYLFESDFLFRPSAIGLYVIGDKVYSLREAYYSNLINISEIYNLYNVKSPQKTTFVSSQKIK